MSILIPSWNGLHLLKENLPSVIKAARLYRSRTGESTEILVVDDGSHDDTVRDLPDLFPGVQLVCREQNGGFAAACNTGFRKCGNELVGLLNNDVRIHSDYFVYKAQHFLNPNVFAVTAKVYEWDRKVFAAGGHLGRFRRGFWSVQRNYDVAGSAAESWIQQTKLLSVYAVGGFATYRRRHLELLGGFHELLSPFHWEDIDLSYRAWKRGWEIHYEPRSLAYHRIAATTSAFYKEKVVETVTLRNRLLFHWINLHTPGLFAQHLVMLFLITIGRTLLLDRTFCRALLSSLGKIRQVRELRSAERQVARRTDREIRDLLAQFSHMAPIERH